MIQRLEEPPSSEWQSLLEKNIQRAEAVSAKMGNRAVAEARIALSEEARAFENELAEVASSLGLAWKVPAFYERGAVVMSGHQPVIYHPGLMQKLNALVALDPGSPVFRINVILDTDEASAGELLFPAASQVGPRLALVDLSTGGPLLANQVVRSTSEVEQIFADILERLDPHLDSGVIEKYRRAGEVFAKLGGRSVLHAQSIVRAQFAPRDYLEVPYSRLLRRREISTLALLPLENIQSFAALYNNCLDHHRESRRIENPANPFPNLAIDSGKHEAPLWLIDTRLGTRAKIFVEHEGSKLLITAGNDVSWTIDVSSIAEFPGQLGERYLIAPRGGWISGLFRAALSDLFIHGFGGGKYDDFTSTFLEQWLGARAPEFIVTSCTRYLYENEVNRFSNALDLKAKFKDLISHTQKYLGRGLFGSEAESKLLPMSERRSQLLELLKSESGAGSEVKYELNALNKAIRTTIEESEIPNLIALADTQELTVDAWMCRTYPFFVFDDVHSKAVSKTRITSV